MSSVARRGLHSQISTRARTPRNGHHREQSRQCGTAPDKTGPLDVTFNAVLQKSPSPGGWTYVVMPGSAAMSAPATAKNPGDATVRLSERLG